MRPTMRQRLRENFQKICEYVWDGYTAPELQPDVQSRQVIALMQIVEVLERRIDTLEALEIHRQGYL